MTIACGPTGHGPAEHGWSGGDRGQQEGLNRGSEAAGATRRQNRTGWARHKPMGFAKHPITVERGGRIRRRKGNN